MALTNRSNGVAGGLVSASWWNDYYSLLTGSMADQPVTVNNVLELDAILTPGGVPTLAAQAGTGLSVGTYTYAILFWMKNGSDVGTYATVNTTTGNQQVALTSIPLGPAGTTARSILRGKVGNSGTLYFVTTINDNTTTSYTDTTADSSLTQSFNGHGSFGGSLIIKDAGGNLRTQLFSDGSILCSGQIGKTVPGDFLDASSGSTIYLKTNSSSGTIQFQFPNGTNSMAFISNAIVVPQWLGIKRQNGTKLAEFLGNGNFIISGSQYQTSGGSISTTTGGTFDSFDVGEVFECDREYPNGTVVCPGPDNKLTLCTHDNCPFALLISYNPGLGLGANDHENGIHYVAMAGRVNARTAQELKMRNFVVSDGRGGVRAAKPGEGAFVLGFTLNETSVIDSHPVVGIYIRPQFLTFRSS